MKKRFSLLRFLVFMVIIAPLVVGGIIVAMQDLQIFPGVHAPYRHDLPLPEGVEELTVETTDGEKIHVWFTPGDKEQKLPYVLIFAHGNYGTVQSFWGTQRMFASWGFDTYSFDYRGYGKSTGWPSEEGIYRDIDAVWKVAQERQGVGPESLVIVGLSLGTGPAAYLAEKVKARVLLLITPFTSIADVARTNIVFRPLLPFLRTNFPVGRYVGLLDETCLIVGHGQRDSVIPFSHGEALISAFRGSGGKHFIVNEVADHNDFVSRERTMLNQTLRRCLTDTREG